jgi:Tol biopolymer transport system component
LLLEKYDGLLRLTASDVEPISLVDSGIIKAAEWAPDGNRIAYLWIEQEADLENILSVMDIIGNHTEPLVKGNLTHFHWLPDGKRLVYFSYSVLENGSSCWAVDVETGERTLLADPGILKQLVFDFAVSPDGTRIAYEGEDGRIWLLVLEDAREPPGLLSRLGEWWNQ